MDVKGILEWTISTYTNAEGSPYFFPISQQMPASICNLNTLKINVYTRPIFYLNVDTLYKSGIGTKSNPIVN